MTHPTISRHKQTSRRLALRASLLLFGEAAGMVAHGQSSLPIYTDSLRSGFQDWSWASHSVNNVSPVRSGTASISVTANVWEGISFWHAEMATAPYSSFSFWAHGGAAGGQRLQVYAQYGTNTGPTYVLTTALTANTWKQYAIPLGTLGISNKADFNRITLQLNNGGSSGTFYVDDVEFTPVALPATVNVNIKDQALGTIDERHFGVNLAIWDQYFDPPHDITSAGLLKELGATIVRMPGGSLSDEYHWAINKSLNNTWEWANSFTDMVRVSTNAGVQAFITVNYGTGTPEEAASWVRHANVTNRLGYKYWEIGNECYGEWERDSNTYPHDPFTYASRATNYIARMKAVDPSIKIGVVAAVGENSFSNRYSVMHPAVNPRTGKTNYGWTPVMLATLKKLGIKPDFLVHHVYPQWTDASNAGNSPNNDVNLLSSTVNWSADAADLRQQITDYFGPGGETIELVCTENNADAGAQGRQSTSLVNGLYYADSFGQVLLAGFRGFVWWDFRNGTDTSGSFSPELYGWRAYGDLGMVNGPSTRHPTFYAAKLMQWFARPGDQIISATSDYSWLAAYAVRSQSRGVNVLVVNKSMVSDLQARIVMTGFAPGSSARVRSYGVPNDEAARTNAAIALQDISSSVITSAGTNFLFAAPRMSMSVISMTLPPLLTIGPTVEISNNLSLSVNAPGGTHVIQRSPDLVNWSGMVTNLVGPSGGSTFNIPQPVGAGFYRAIWVP